MLKTTVRKITLTTEYTNIIPTDLKSFAMMQFIVPAGGVDYKYNDDTEVMHKQSGKCFTHPLNLPRFSEGCNDIIWMKASQAGTTVQAEFQYCI